VIRTSTPVVNGSQAVSEQGLLEQAMERLPSQAVVVGDAHFGVFAVAYAAEQLGHPVVLLGPTRNGAISAGVGRRQRRQPRWRENPLARTR